MAEDVEHDREFGSNLFKEIERHWIKPELEKRFGETLPADFRIERCLIRMPAGLAPIVEFNGEFGFAVEADLRDDKPPVVDADVYLHDIKKIRRVQPISYEGKYVSFVALLSSEGRWSVLFDVSVEPRDLDTAPWSFNDRLVKYLEDRITARVAAYAPSQLALLRSIGLWPAPSLLPYPLSFIVKQLQDGDAVAAEQTFTSHCDEEFLGGLLKQWSSVPEFEKRSDLFRDALSAHLEQKYGLSIHALIPHVEGVMTDWLHTRPGSPSTKAAKRTRAVCDIIAQASTLTPTGAKIVKGAVEFILNGPVLENFEKWTDPISTAFPNRHALLHGKYEPLILSEANSAKAFLLLDTLWHMLKAAS